MPVLGWAARGSLIAYGLGVALITLIVPFAAYALIYWVSYTLVTKKGSYRPAVSKPGSITETRETE